MYVSVTGLSLKSSLQAPRFWWHALHSMRQAQGAAGNLSVDARKIAGVHHTLSTWVDTGAMRAFLTSGQHLKAMKAFRQIATGSTVGFDSDTMPTWEEAHAIWLERGRDV